MLSDPNDVPGQFIEGAAKAGVELGIEEIKKLIVKFKNKDLAFINDFDRIKLVKEQRESPEWKYYSKYIQDRDLRILIQMGITLRKLESKPADLQELRSTIKNKFGASGLHVAQFTQSQIVGKYIQSVIASAKNEHELGNRLEEFLKNIDRYCVFIKAEDYKEMKCKELVTRIHSFMPPVFVIYSYGDEAAKIMQSVQECMKPQLLNYEIEEYNEHSRRITFFNKKDEGDPPAQ